MNSFIKPHVIEAEVVWNHLRTYDFLRVAQVRYHGSFSKSNNDFFTSDSDEEGFDPVSWGDEHNSYWRPNRARNQKKQCKKLNLALRGSPLKCGLYVCKGTESLSTDSVLRAPNQHCTGFRKEEVDVLASLLQSFFGERDAILLQAFLRKLALRPVARRHGYPVKLSRMMNCSAQVEEGIASESLGFYAHRLCWYQHFNQLYSTELENEYSELVLGDILTTRATDRQNPSSGSSPPLGHPTLAQRSIRWVKYSRWLTEFPEPFSTDELGLSWKKLGLFWLSSLHNHLVRALFSMQFDLVYNFLRLLPAGLDLLLLNSCLDKPEISEPREWNSLDVGQRGDSYMDAQDGDGDTFQLLDPIHARLNIRLAGYGESHPFNQIWKKCSPLNTFSVSQSIMSWFIAHGKFPGNFMEVMGGKLSEKTGRDRGKAEIQGCARWLGDSLVQIVAVVDGTTFSPKRPGKVSPCYLVHLASTVCHNSMRVQACLGYRGLMKLGVAERNSTNEILEHLKCTDSSTARNLSSIPSLSLRKFLKTSVHTISATCLKNPKVIRDELERFNSLFESEIGGYGGLVHTSCEACQSFALDYLQEVNPPGYDWDEVVTQIMERVASNGDLRKFIKTHYIYEWRTTATDDIPAAEIFEKMRSGTWRPVKQTVVCAARSQLKILEYLLDSGLVMVDFVHSVPISGWEEKTKNDLTILPLFLHATQHHKDFPENDHHHHRRRDASLLKEEDERITKIFLTLVRLGGGLTGSIEEEYSCDLDDHTWFLRWNCLTSKWPEFARAYVNYWRTKRGDNTILSDTMRLPGLYRQPRFRMTPLGAVVCGDIGNCFPCDNDWEKDRRNEPKFSQRLLDLGADVNQIWNLFDEDDVVGNHIAMSRNTKPLRTTTAINLLCLREDYSNCQESFEVLLDHGADPNLPPIDSNGMNPLENLINTICGTDEQYIPRKRDELSFRDNPPHGWNEVTDCTLPCLQRMLQAGAVFNKLNLEEGCRNVKYNFQGRNPKKAREGHVPKLRDWVNGYSERQILVILDHYGQLFPKFASKVLSAEDIFQLSLDSPLLFASFAKNIPGFLDREFAFLGGDNLWWRDPAEKQDQKYHIRMRQYMFDVFLRDVMNDLESSKIFGWHRDNSTILPKFQKFVEAVGSDQMPTITMSTNASLLEKVLSMVLTKFESEELQMGFFPILFKYCKDLHSIPYDVYSRIFVQSLGLFGYPSVVQLAIGNKVPRLGLKDADQYGMTLLHYAVINSHWLVLSNTNGESQQRSLEGNGIRLKWSAHYEEEEEGFVSDSEDDDDADDRYRLDDLFFSNLWSKPKYFNRQGSNGVTPVHVAIRAGLIRTRRREKSIVSRLILNHLFSSPTFSPYIDWNGLALSSVSYLMLAIECANFSLMPEAPPRNTRGRRGAKKACRTQDSARKAALDLIKNLLEAGVDPDQQSFEKDGAILELLTTGFHAVVKPITR